MTNRNPTKHWRISRNELVNRYYPCEEGTPLDIIYAGAWIGFGYPLVNHVRTTWKVIGEDEGYLYGDAFIPKTTPPFEGLSLPFVADPYCLRSVLYSPGLSWVLYPPDSLQLQEREDEGSAKRC
jgi:hypothetical protein